MKVLMTTDNIGGIWTFAIDLALGLKESGIEVFLAITGNPMDDEQKKELEDIPFYFAGYKQEWMENPWDDIREAGKWLMEIQDEVQPDVVHLNSYTHAALNWKAPVVITFHSCVISWWQSVKGESAPSDWNTYYEKVKKGLESAALVIAPTIAMLSEAEKHYGTFRNKKVIYNGRDPGDFSPGEKEKMVFSMGRLWDEAKNIRQVIKAAEFSYYPFYIAGNQQSFNPGDLPANVHLTGFLPPSEIKNRLSKAAVYLLPVKYEPFGYTFLEAAFSGCALIGGNIPTQHEIWENDMIYVDPGNPAEIARAVNHLMEHDDQRKKLAEGAYRRSKKFFPDGMIRNYSREYKKLKIKNTSLFYLSN